MAPQSPATTSQSRTQAWLNAIPLGSLEQLQNSTGKGHVAASALDHGNEAIAVSTTESSRVQVPIGRSHLGSDFETAHKTRLPQSQSSTKDLVTRPSATSEAVAGASQDAGSRPVSATGSSLQQLEQAGGAIDDLQAAANVDGADLPLPVSESPASEIHASDALSLQTERQHARGREPEALTYWQRVSLLSKGLPHLRSLNPNAGRHKQVGSVTCFDYLSRQQSLPRRLSLHGRSSRRAYLEQISGLNTISDFEVVTRVMLVEDMSSDLLECLGQSFEIDPEFFAVHLNRSGYDRMDYQDETPDHWRTNNLPKAYASLKWYRPARQSPTVSEWLKQPAELLDKHSVGKKDQAKDVRGSIAWVEQTPLQIIQHQVTVSNNIFRRNWTLSARFNDLSESSKSSARDVDEDTPKWESSAPLTAWEERASVFCYEKAVAPILIILLDPLPAMSDHQKIQSLRALPRSGSSAGAVELSESIRMDLPMVSRVPLDFPINKFEATRGDIERLSKWASWSYPTRRATEQWLFQGQLRDFQAFRAEPILALLRVVQIDTKAFFKALEFTLDEISEDSLDDYKLSRRLSDWRKLLSDFEIEVPAIGHSVHDLVAFVFRGSNVPAEIQEIVSDLDGAILLLEKRLTDAHVALRADMQFTESRRSIDEAKTVNKLTELAFVFIPLSFSCSLFSMEINELKNGVPVWTFIITAVSLALLAYAVRIAITSDYLETNYHRALERIKKKKSIGQGERVPTLTLLALTADEIWTNGGQQIALVLLFVATFVVIPVIFMWRSTKLDPGFDISITLLLVFSGFGIAYSIFGLGDPGDPTRRIVRWFHSRGDSPSVASSSDWDA